MATDPKRNARAELEAAIARAARALREDPLAAIQVPPPLSEEEIAEMPGEDEERQRKIDRLYEALEREHPEVKDIMLSDLIRQDRDA
jgi:hypothetical protein